MDSKFKLFTEILRENCIESRDSAKIVDKNKVVTIKSEPIDANYEQSIGEKNTNTTGDRDRESRLQQLNQLNEIYRKTNQLFGVSQIVDQLAETDVNINENNSQAFDKPLYECLKCDELFTSEDKLRLHENKVHTNNEFNCLNTDFNNEYKRQLVRQSNQVKGYECSAIQCVHSFDHSIELREHLPNCDKSENSFKTISALYEDSQQFHMTCTYMCPICGQRYDCKNTFERHVKTHDKYMNRLNCEECDQSFDSEVNLAMHVNRDHRSAEPFVCMQCKQNFHTNDKLSNHLASKHNIPVFGCNSCKYKTKNKYQLSRHRNRHSKEFKCAIDDCNEVFETKYNLSIHKRIKHSNTDRQYDCGQECDWESVVVKQEPMDESDCELNANNFDINSTLNECNSNSKLMEELAENSLKNRNTIKTEEYQRIDCKTSDKNVEYIEKHNKRTNEDSINQMNSDSKQRRILTIDELEERKADNIHENAYEKQNIFLNRNSGIECQTNSNSKEFQISLSQSENRISNVVNNSLMSGSILYNTSNELNRQNNLRYDLNYSLYMCRWPECGQHFARKKLLDCHMLSHSGYKPWVCDWNECRFRTDSRDHLQQHKQWHKTHINCLISDCKHVFATKPELYLHMKSCHSSEVHSVGGQYACNWIGCDFKANNTTVLNIHKKTHRKRVYSLQTNMKTRTIEQNINGFQTNCYEFNNGFNDTNLETLNSMNIKQEIIDEL